MALPLTSSSRQLWPLPAYLSDFLLHQLFVSLIHLELCVEITEKKIQNRTNKNPQKELFHSETDPWTKTEMKRDLDSAPLKSDMMKREE